MDLNRLQLLSHTGDDVLNEHRPNSVKIQQFNTENRESSSSESCCPYLLCNKSKLSYHTSQQKAPVTINRLLSFGPSNRMVVYVPSSTKQAAPNLMIFNEACSLPGYVVSSSHRHFTFAIDDQHLEGWEDLFVMTPP